MYKFPAEIDPVRLMNAFEKAVNAHPGMKVRLKMDGDEVVQYVHDDEPVKIILKKARESEVKALMKMFIRPGALLGSLLYRIELYRTEKKLYAFFEIHHIIFDGYSASIFNRDLLLAYAGGEPARETFTSCDYAGLEFSQKRNREYLEAEAWFEKMLKGITMMKGSDDQQQENRKGCRRWKCHPSTVPPQPSSLFRVRRKR